jgi:hypothetical protein
MELPESRRGRRARLERKRARKPRAPPAATGLGCRSSRARAGPPAAAGFRRPPLASAGRTGWPRSGRCGSRPPLVEVEMRSPGPVAGPAEDAARYRCCRPVGAPAFPAPRVVLGRGGPPGRGPPPATGDTGRPRSGDSGRRGSRPPRVKVETRSPGPVAWPGPSARPLARPLSSSAWVSEQGVSINHTIPQSTHFAPLSPMRRERRYNPAHTNISDFSGNIVKT